MTAPFHASKLFANNAGNADGWDDWDWNDSSSTPRNATPQHQHQPPNMNQAKAFAAPMSNYFQPTHPQPLPPNVNNNVMPNIDDSNINSVGPLLDNHTTSQDWFQQQPYPPPPVANSNNNIMPSQAIHTPPPAFQTAANINNDFNDYRQIESSGHQQSAEAFAAPEENRQTGTPSGGFAPPPVVPVYKASAQPTLPPPALDQSPYLNTNPFKRVGPQARRTPSPAVSTSTPPGAFQPHMEAPQQQHPAFHQQPLPSNGFAGQIPMPIPPDAHQPTENNELAPHHDRNEYLQTGHLSEEGSAPETIATNDSLPPPGLSRLVLGEPEAVHSPPLQAPLERQVPGNELSYPSNLSFERQADGQDTDEPNRSIIQYPTPAPPPPMQSLQPESQLYIPTGSETQTDRNHYHVAGESNSTNAAQRVITGVENVENQEVPIAEQQREREMDGENIEDNLQSSRRQEREREEPIEGANMQDDIASSAISAPQVPTTSQSLAQSDSVEDLDASSNFHQKYQSNGSTGNDESDKEKSYHGRKATGGRRSEEKARKKDDKRYETEDTDYDRYDRRRTRDAPRDKYERNENGYESSKERGAKRGDKADRSFRDRPSGRDKQNRDDKEERFERRNRDRGNRYDTDVSRYETEDSRYDNENRRKGERDYGRYGDDRADKSYRRERGRSDRDRGRERNERDDRRRPGSSIV